MRQLKDIDAVAESQLCSGCGACAFVNSEQIRMVDDLRYGRRPMRISPNEEKNDDLALRVCPGVRMDRPQTSRDDVIPALLPVWGTALRVLEGYAGDGEIRFQGSSGGVATALALYCLQAKGFSGVLHTGARTDIPYLNETVVSQNREDLLSRTGSRYAPSSPCDGIQRILDIPGKFVFIGKPCDVFALRKVMEIYPDVAEKIGLTIAFFCAGVPSTQGTLDLMQSVGIEDVSTVTSLRYRGQGWPGVWKAKFRTEADKEQELTQTYLESWKFLSKYKQWRCNICPDHIGEYADIAVGDPWYRTPQEGELGSSLIICRTIVGQDILADALRSGDVCAIDVDATLVLRSHPSQPASRGMCFGRLFGLWLACVPYPRFYGFSLFKFWVSSLTARERYQSVVGAVRRVVKRKLFRSQPVCEFKACDLNK